jgi:hypothetical protein
MWDTLYMDNFFSSPLDNLHTKTINCHRGLLDRTEKGCQRILDIKWKWRVVTKTKVSSNLKAILWKDTQNVNILMNMHSPPLKGNFWHEHSKAVNLAIQQDHNRHTEYVDKSDQITVSYCISRLTWDWRKKIIITIINSFITLASYGLDLLHWQLDWHWWGTYKKWD